MQSRNSGFDADMSMTDGEGMGVSGDQLQAGLDPLANVGERKKLNAGSLVLVVVVVVAGIGVWSMRAMTKVGATTVRNTDVESTIDDFLGSLKSGNSTSKSGETSTILAPTDKVLSVLTETYTQRQVPLTDVQRNPFIREGDGEQAPVPTDPGKGIAKRLAERKTQIENAANRLQLKSIIMSKVPIANISGKIVRPDD